MTSPNRRTEGRVGNYVAAYIGCASSKGRLGFPRDPATRDEDTIGPWRL